MTVIIKAIFILLLQIIIFYLFGSLFEYLCRRKHGILFKIITGFLVYQIVFQICAIPMIGSDQSLTRLTVLWCGIVSVCCVITIALCRKRITEDCAMVVSQVRSHRRSFFLVLLLLGIICYYVCINGELNDDSTYYIGLINTTLTSDQLYKFNAYTGVQMDSHYLRRAFVTFDINTAVACKVYGIHPLIITRITRACLNVLLTGGVVYLIGRILFREEKDPFEKAGIFTCLAMVCNYLFDNTIYTSATFLLHRAYEGKAYAGNVLMYFTIYICILIITQKRKWNYVYLLITLWACIAISSSAILVTGAASLVLLIPFWIVQLWGRIKQDRNYE